MILDTPIGIRSISTLLFVSHAHRPRVAAEVRGHPTILFQSPGQPGRRGGRVRYQKRGLSQAPWWGGIGLLGWGIPGFSRGIDI